MANKRRTLRRAGLLNPKSDQVASPLFQRLAFFDPDDKLQVKYEMLRAHELDRTSVTQAAADFGYTRQAFYQIQQAFRERGMAGLLDRKRGRKGPLKCTSEVVAFIERTKRADPEVSGSELAERLRAERGIEVHRRTIEKLVAKMGRSARKKKRPRAPSPP